MENISKIDQFYIEFDIVASDFNDLYRIDDIRRSNSDFRFDSTTSIRFGDPNRISLIPIGHPDSICNP